MTETKTELEKNECGDTGRRRTYRGISMLGKKFGKLSVLRRSPRIGNCVYWICRCDCGDEKEIEIAGTSLRRLKRPTISCGCAHQGKIIHSRRKDLSGLKFGKLTALYALDKPNKHRDIMWVCVP